MFPCSGDMIKSLLNSDVEKHLKLRMCALRFIVSSAKSEEVELCDKQHEQAQVAEEDEKNREEDEDEDESQNLLLIDIGDLPLCPSSATRINFVSYFITGFLIFHYLISILLQIRE